MFVLFKYDEWQLDSDRFGISGNKPSYHRYWKFFLTYDIENNFIWKAKRFSSFHIHVTGRNPRALM